MQVQCEFSALECPHDGQPMFSTEYKRSNRTRMSKILRCFPHCCPTHRPRSYCGSALYLSVRLVSPVNDQIEARDAEEQLPLWTVDVPSPTQTLNDLIVYGRFETHDPDDPLKTELTLGQRIPSASITVEHHADVIWVEGSHATTENAFLLTNDSSTGPSRVFVLNEGDGESHHWEYDWRSGTSQRKRACQHQFRAYVFLPDASDSATWQVVGIASSTPFTLSSYRKQDDEELESGAVDLAAFRESPAVALDPPVPPIAPRGGPVAATMMPPPPVQPATAILVALQHQAAARDTTKLAVLMNLLSVVDVSWIDPEILTRYAVSILGTRTSLHEATSEAPVVDAALIQYPTNCAYPLLAALSVPSPRPRIPYASTVWFAKWRGTLELCIDVVCQLAMNGTLTRLQTIVVRAAGVADDVQVRASYATFVDVLATEIEGIVRQLSNHASMDLLVDNIVSCVCDEDADFDWVPRLTRDEALRVLRNTSLLGLDAYREQLRQCAIADVPTGVFQSEISRLFTGVWVCKSIDDSASRSLRNAASDFGISALTALQLLLCSQSFEMVMDGDATSLRMRSGWSFFSHLWSAFNLDGYLHASAILPNGLSPQIWAHFGVGAIVGDYRGALRRVDDDAVVLDLDFFVYGVNAPSYCVQLTLVPVFDRVHELQVHARVYRTRLISEVRVVGQEELMQMNPERRCELVAFAAEDLVVAAMASYEQRP